MCDKNCSLSFISGVVVGAAVGAFASILLAPRSGKETRAKIKNQGEEFLKKSEESLSDLKKERFDPFVKKVQKQVTEKFEDIKAKEPFKRNVK